MATADIEDLLKEKFEITTDIIGHEEESMKQTKVLNRFMSVKDGGCTHEPDVRHFGDDRQGARAARCEKNIEHTGVRHEPRV